MFHIRPGSGFHHFSHTISSQVDILKSGDRCFKGGYINNYKKSHEATSVSRKLQNTEQ